MSIHFLLTGLLALGSMYGCQAQTRMTCPWQESNCQTIATKLKAQPCVFPFIFGNVAYTDCVAYGDQGKSWCSTKTNAGGVHQVGYWGNCYDDKATLKTTDGTYCLPFWFDSGRTEYKVCKDDGTKSYCGLKTLVDTYPTSQQGVDWQYCDGSGSCTATYTSTVDKGTYGCDLVPNIATVELCKAECTKKAGCTHINWRKVVTVDTANQRCYIGTITNPLSYDSTAIDTYTKKTTCVGLTTPIGVTATTLLPGCPSYSGPATNTYSQGGVEVTGVSTVSGCKETCTADNNCYGFDFTSANKCYKLTEQAIKTKLSGSNVDQYTKIPCSATTIGTSPSVCVDTYDETKNKLSFNGQALGLTVKGKEACLAECGKKDTCVGFDLNTAGDCWLHTAETIGDSIVLTDNSVSQYKRVKCTPSSPTGPPGCVDTFLEYAKTLSFGGAIQSDFSSVPTCQGGCLNEKSCLAIDYSIADNACYFHVDPVYLTKVMKSDGVTQYRRQPCAVATTTAKPASPTGCVDSFDAFPETNSYSGTPVPNVNTLEGCQTACLKDAKCLALDFDSAACYLHKDGYLNNLNPSKATGVTQYRRKPCTAVSPTSPSVCTDTYTSKVNTNSFTGTKLDGKPGESKCKDACNSQSTCVGFDLNTLGECWWHTAASFTEKGSATGVTQYSRTSTCPVTTPGGTATTPSPSVCQDTFSRTNNTLTFGGKEQPSNLNTIALCQDACRATSPCYGFDFGRLTNRCFFHSKADFVNSKQTGDNVDQFVREPCTPASPGTTPPGSPSPGPCQDTFSLMNDTNAFDGALNGETTLEGCQKSCLDADKCTSFDFVYKPPTSCWLFTTTVAQLNEDAKGVAHYTREKCSVTSPPECVDSYTEVKNIGSWGGVDSVSDNTKDKCSTRCNGQSDCYGFDFDYSKNACYLHKNQEFTKEGNVYPAININQYRRVPCTKTTVTGSPSACVVTYTLEAGYYYQGGSEIAMQDTEEKCKDACTKDEACLAVDFNTDTKRCYGLNKAIYILPDNREVGKEVNHFRKVPCIGQTTTAIPQTTTQKVTCSDIFVMYEDTNAGGGVQQNGVTTVAACQDRCLQSSTYCFAFDMNGPPNPCFLHFAKPTRKNSGGVTHYERKANTECGTVTTPAPAATTPATCKDSFALTANIFSYNGAEYANIMQLADCQNQCSADSSCLGIDWNPSANSKCFLHVNKKDFDETFPANGIDRYTITRCDTITGTPQPGCTMENKGSFNKDGNTRIATSVTYQECQTLCLYRKDCLAVIHNRITNECWMDAVGVLPTEGNSDCCSLAEKRCPGECMDSYSFYPDTDYFKANSRADTATSQSGCAVECYKYPSCLGFVFNKILAQCNLILDNSIDFNVVNNNRGNYRGLDLFIRNICGVTKAPTGPCVVDLVILLDCSGSIKDAGSGNWDLMTSFAKDIVSNLVFGDDGSRAAVVTFSDAAIVDEYFPGPGEIQTKDTVHRAIDRATYQGGQTFTSKAFMKYDTELRGGNNRQLVSDVLILITDGATTDEDKPALQSYVDSLRGQVPIVVVAIGQANIPEIQKISPNLYHNVSDFTALDKVIGNIFDGTVCGVPTPPPTPTADSGRIALFAYNYDNRMANGFSNTMIFHEVAFDLAGFYNNLTGDINVPITGVYYVNLNLGTKHGSAIKMSLRVKGTNVILAEVMHNSTNNDGVDTLTIDSIVKMDSSLTYMVSMTDMNDLGPMDTYSDLDKITSLAIFYLEGAMNPVVYFMAEKYDTFTTTPARDADLGIFDLKLESHSGSYDLVNNVFACPQDGVYSVSFAVLTVDSQPVNLQLSVEDTFETRLVEIRRDHARGGRETLCRTILLNCAGVMRLNLIRGQAHKISWQAFLYEPYICEDMTSDVTCPYPPKHSDVYWVSVLNQPFKNEGGQHVTVPFTLLRQFPNDVWTVLNEVACTVSGYYFVTLTVELQNGMIPNVYIENSANEYRNVGIHRSSKFYQEYGTDTLSRSGIMFCLKGSFIRVRMRNNAGIISSSDPGNIIGSAFAGYLVYNYNPMDSILYEK